MTDIDLHIRQSRTLWILGWTLGRIRIVELKDGLYLDCELCKTQPKHTQRYWKIEPLEDNRFKLCDDMIAEGKTYTLPQLALEVAQAYL